VTFQIVVDVNWQIFLLYLLIEVFLIHLHHLICFILMYGDLLLLPQKEGLDIMSLLLIIILVIVGFI
jgi:hypothetical protein